MGRTKYVVIEQMGALVPIIFSNLMSHDTFKHLRPKSAGFAYIAVVGMTGNDRLAMRVSVSGKSDSLNLGSRPEDAELIRKAVVWYEY